MICTLLHASVENRLIVEVHIFHWTSIVGGRNYNPWKERQKPLQGWAKRWKESIHLPNRHLSALSLLVCFRVCYIYIYKICKQLVKHQLGQSGWCGRNPLVWWFCTGRFHKPSSICDSANFHPTSAGKGRTLKPTCQVHPLSLFILCLEIPTRFFPGWTGSTFQHVRNWPCQLLRQWSFWANGCREMAFQGMNLSKLKLPTTWMLKNLMVAISFFGREYL